MTTPASTKASLPSHSPRPGGPVVIVTGASRGYGLAIVKQLFTLSKDCRVVATGRSSDKLAELQAASPQDRIQTVSGDITDEHTLTSIVQRAITTWGRLDAVVHNAGVLDPMGSLATISAKEFDALFQVNLMAPLRLAQHAVPYLKATKGRQIFISSGAATKAYPGWGAYCASKAALNMLTASWAADEPDVTSVAIRPGVLDTDMQAHIRSQGPGRLPDSMLQYFVDAHAKGTLVSPDVSGRVIAQLCLSCPPHLSGQFFDWEDEALSVAGKSTSTKA